MTKFLVAVIGALRYLNKIVQQLGKVLIISLWIKESRSKKGEKQLVWYSFVYFRPAYGT